MQYPQYRSDPIHAATDKGSVEALAQALQSVTNKKLDEVDSHGKTAVWKAAAYGRDKCLSLLIQHGADIHIDCCGMTPLMAAASCCRATCTQILLENGAKMNQQDSDGSTALHGAVRFGGLPCAVLLMEFGADRSITNNVSASLLHPLLPALLPEVNAPLDPLRAIYPLSQKGLTAADTARRFCPDQVAARIKHYTRWTGHMVRWRHAADARRDAGMVFQAAAEGRPMELGKRLRLGKLAGGLEIEGTVVLEDGSTRTGVLPLEAARLGGHEECAELLEADGQSISDQDD